MASPPTPTHAARQRLPWPDPIAIAALIALAILFAWRLVFTDRILPRGDMFLYFYPYWHYRALALRAGDIPLWNPYLFMGAPFLANSQAGVLYPPNWLLIALDAPSAVKAATVAHLAWAALGTYLYARRTLRLTIAGAVTAAAVFAFGGYLTSQIEHINQLQGLAWLPWLVWLWHEAITGRPRALAWLGIAWAMQLLAGHTQTSFISGVGLGGLAAWTALVRWRETRQHPAPQRWRSVVRPLAAVGAAALLAAGLAAAQLLPTFELARLSHRGGGLSLIEAVSFSLRPPLIGRALLPSFTQPPLFSEYVAYIGMAGLVLAVPGLWTRRRDRAAQGMLLLGLVGLFLAFGAYNPVYWLLVRFVPGFDLFRAPARWLVLYAFGAASLAGAGLDALAPTAGRPRPPRWGWLALAIAPAALIGLSTLAPHSAGEVAGAAAPTPAEAVVWAAILLAAVGLAALALRRSARIAQPVMAVLVVVELFAASRQQPFNRLSLPAAWSSQRPAISWLLAGSQDEIPPPRILSLSDTLFDPGDLREIRAAYSPYLDEDSLFDTIVAIKQKEILAPNLPLAWGIPSMDGFDGGILPTRDYTGFTSLFLPSQAVASDGRLREFLDAVPGAAWLRLAGVRWIITDKVADQWIDNVYYDTQFPSALTVTGSPQMPPVVVALPQHSLEATAVGIVGTLSGHDGLAPGMQIGTVAVYTAEDELPLVQPLVLGHDLVEPVTFVGWPVPFRASRVEVSVVTSFPATLTVQGVSLIDERTGAFTPTTLSQAGELRLAYSADVKIYELSAPAALPRAYVVCDPVLVSSDTEALARLAQNPSGAVVVTSEGLAPLPASCLPADPGSAAITAFEPERVEIAVSAGQGAGTYLVLSDAWYPGWEARVDGEPAEVLKANGMFRAVAVPPGEHEVVFAYVSQPFRIGLAASGISLAIAIGIAAIRWPGQ
jgi:hypothetical protein